MAVLDEMDKIDAALEKTRAARTALGIPTREAARGLLEQEATTTTLDREILSLRARTDEDQQVGRVDAQVHQRREVLAGLEATRRRLEEQRASLADLLERHQGADAAAVGREAALTARREKIAAHQTIFTVDTELDQIITAFKLTFMCLCAQLMKRYLGTHLEIDTLIRGVLTLPGERVLTPGVETTRIFRQPRDIDPMPRWRRPAAC